jgi:AcrR family transcriptional regulator
MQTKTTLSADDWIKAAFRTLSAGGVQAIKAEAIARDLKVSKGSFYWHFKDVPDLKAQMLEHWSRAATGAIIADIEAAGGSPRDRLRLLVEEATGDRSLPYGGMLAESAIREWGRHDAAAAGALKTVDTHRLAYVAELFGTGGFTADQGAAKARLLYGALIGLETLAAEGLADLRGDMFNLLTDLLADS